MKMIFLKPMGQFKIGDEHKLAESSTRSGCIVYIEREGEKFKLVEKYLPDLVKQGVIKLEEDEIPKH